MPALGWIFADAPVYCFAEEVGVAGVASVLLDEVADEAAEAGVPAVRPGDVRELVESAVGERRFEARAGTLDRAVPQGVQLFRCVVGRGVELPVVVVLPPVGIPGRIHRLAPELHEEHVVLVRRQVLQQPTDRHRRRPDPSLQPGRVQRVRLPAERRTQPIKRPHQVLDLVTRQRRFPRSLSHSATLTPVPDVPLPDNPNTVITSLEMPPPTP